MAPSRSRAVPSSRPARVGRAPSPALDAVPDRRTVVRTARPGDAIPIRVDVDADTDTPISAFLKLSEGQSHAFLFESVEGGEHWGRWSFLGAGPRRIRTWNLGDAGDPLAELERDLTRHRGVVPEGTPRFAGGWVGFLSYDAVRLFEPHVPIDNPDTLGLPTALFMDFDTVVAFDNLKHRVSVIAEVRVDEKGDVGKRYDAALARIRRTIKTLEGPLPKAPRRRPSDKPMKLRPTQSRRSFEAAVARSQEYIRAGDCQQIVLSQRFETETDVAPFDLYRALRRVNPSPYMFFVRAGDDALIGSSPETLVRVEEGDVVLRPIAGTRRRGKDEEEDRQLEQELIADPKENAEHTMLVDLGRNDVGRVSQIGTVRVEQLKVIERYSHVMHLVSQVRGKLRPDLGPFDVLRACFPAGTVSGAPKVRAMQIIDELERERRGPYAGCVGYVDRRGQLEMCIAIRTLVQSGKRLVAQAGAGVVYDSVPSAEYEETLNKSRALAVALQHAGARR